MPKTIKIDEEVWTEAQLEARLNESYKVGISSGLEQAANKLMNKALVAFGGNRDSEAKLLRELATELTGLSEAAHPRTNPPVKVPS